MNRSARRGRSSAKRSIGSVGVVALAVTLLVGCGDGSGPGVGECSEEAAFCSLNDVGPEALTRMIELSEKAHEIGQDPARTWGDVAHFLDAQGDVVDVTMTPTEISFRVPGAPTSYLLSELAAPSLELPEGESAARSSQTAGGTATAAATASHVVQTAAWQPAAGTSAVPSVTAARATALTGHAPSGVGTDTLRRQPVGEPGAGHDRNPKKRALVLEPYGPMGANPVAADLVAELGALGQHDVDYYGDVRHWPASFTILDVLTNLDRYDVIYISTHGAANGFAASNARDWYEQIPGSNEYRISDSAPKIPSGIGTARGPDGKLRFYVTHHFFENFYPGGLTDTLFFADWCQSAKEGVFRAAVLGSGSVYLGWSQTVGIDLAARAARYFWEGMVDWRVDSSSAYLNVVEHGSHYQPPINPVAQGVQCVRGNPDDGKFTCPEWYDSTLHIFTPDQPLHVIDTVTSFQGPSRIRAGTSLAWTGDVDDGEKDTLDEIRLTVVGLDPEMIDPGYVQIVLDGAKLPERIAVADMEVTATDGQHWEEREIVLKDVELPFDVSAEQTEKDLLWEVGLVGPGSSVSLHEVDGVRLKGEEPEVLVVHPEFFHELADGDEVEVAGTEGDGEPESADIAVQVEDIGRERIDEYYVEVTVTGGTIDGERFFTWPLADFRDLGHNRWRMSAPLDLDRDLTDGNRPLTVDARVFHDDSPDLVSVHGPTVLLHAQKEEYCSAHLTVQGTLTHHGQTYGVNYSAPATPNWADATPPPSFHLYGAEGPLSLDPVTSEVFYTFRVELEGIEPGMTGTFTVPAEMLWVSNRIDPATGTNLLAHGDLTLTITEHRKQTFSGDPDMVFTDAVRGTLSGMLGETGGPDDRGMLDVHVTFAHSEEGCYGS